MTDTITRPTHLSPELLLDARRLSSLLVTSAPAALPAGDLVAAGVSVEADPGLAAVAGEHVGTLLRAVRESGPASPVQLGALYLLGFLTGHRDEVLAGVADADLDPGDRTRLERRLAPLDPDAPDLGRCWPSPSVWSVGEEQTDADRAVIAGLSPEQVRTNWENDTRSVAAFAGARALWAARTGRVPTPTGLVPIGEPATPSADPDADLFAPFVDVMSCPRTGAPLRLDVEGARLSSPAGDYPVVSGVVDVDAAPAAPDEDTADLLAKLAMMPTLGEYYETMLRPCFLQIAGGNWGGDVTVADEQAYLHEHLSGAAGRLLDVACGAGRWTEMITAAAPGAHVLGLDMAPPMITAMRARVPEVPAVHASALDMPFTDGAMDHLVCWNALQAFPDDAEQAVHEFARCVAPGGTLVLYTFLFSQDPVMRHFQESHYFPSRTEGMLLFEEDALRRWVDEAGLDVEDWSARDSGVMMTLRRRPA